MVDTLSVKFNITFHHRVTAYALQMGGWLPLAFCSAPMLLVDRNVTGMLRAIDRGEVRGDIEANEWWLEFLNSQSFFVNPVLCAIEGKSRSSPSYEEFGSAFVEARAVLQKGLPKARIIDYEEKHYRAAYEIVKGFTLRYEAEVRFLVSVAPMIAERHRDNVLPRVERKICELAVSCGLSLRSFPLITALSCLYEPRDGTEPRIGRGVIKPSRIYSEEQAHNAIADFQALETLVAVNLLGGLNSAFCTRDKYLAALWCGMQISDLGWRGGVMTFSITPIQKLFPRLNLGQHNALLKRLWSNDDV